MIPAFVTDGAMLWESKQRTVHALPAEADRQGSEGWIQHWSRRTTEIYTHISRGNLFVIRSLIEEMDLDKQKFNS
jgi:hypothetical protein